MIAILERLGCVDRWKANAKIKGQTPGLPKMVTGNKPFARRIAPTISQSATVPPLPTRKGCPP